MREPVLSGILLAGATGCDAGLPSVTHFFDQNARFLPLAGTPLAGTPFADGLHGDPADVAPPGQYLLYLLDSAGVPSTATCSRSRVAAAARPADFDGDGDTDLAVFRNGVWYERTPPPP